MRLCSTHYVELVIVQGVYVVRGELWSWLYWRCPMCDYVRPHKYTMPRLEATL